MLCKLTPLPAGISSLKIIDLQLEFQSILIGVADLEKEGLLSLTKKMQKYDFSELKHEIY